MNGVAVDRPTAACSLAHGPNDRGECEWCGAPEAQGRWCGRACRDAYDEAHIWARARTAALHRAARRCQVCGSRPVEVHHVEPTDGYGPGCAHHAANLTVLCRAHHRHDHRNLRAPVGTQLVLAVDLAA